MREKDTKVTYVDGTTNAYKSYQWLTRNNIPNIENASKVVIGDSIIWIAIETFVDCTMLKEVEMPDSIVTIFPSAFAGCTSLQSMVIPSGVTQILDYAFYNCKNLSSVTINNSKSKIKYCQQMFDKINPNAKLYVPSNLLSGYKRDKKYNGAFTDGIEGT